MYKYKKIIALCMIVCIVVSNISVAFATTASDTDIKSNTTIWNVLAEKAPFTSIFDVVGYACGDICAESPDGYHHASGYYASSATGKYRCTCKYCGKSFTGHDTDIATAYKGASDQMQNEQGTTSFDQDGNLIFYPSSSALDCTNVFADGVSRYGEGRYYDYPSSHYASYTFFRTYSSYVSSQHFQIFFYFLDIPSAAYYLCYPVAPFTGVGKYPSNSVASPSNGAGKTSAYSVSGDFTAFYYTLHSVSDFKISFSYPYLQSVFPVSTSYPAVNIEDFNVYEGDEVKNFLTLVNLPDNYTYDFSSRTYSYEGGSIQFGDNNVTYVDSDNVTHVYNYYVEQDPTESPDPSEPTDSGSDSGTDCESYLVEIQRYVKNIDGTLTDMSDQLKTSNSLLEKILAKLDDILKAIKGIDTTVEVTVEDDDNVTTESGFNGLLGKFAFLTQIQEIVSNLMDDVKSDSDAAYDFTSGSKSRASGPTVSFSFPASDVWGVNWSGLKSLDLSWYAEYKPTVDGILSGILWFNFLWLLFKRAPEIIRGAGLMTDYHEDLEYRRRM